MTALTTADPLALRLLMTDDLYYIGETAEPVALSTAREEAVPVHFDYLGENNRYILILLKDQQQKIIDQENLKVLTSIFTARQIELRDVAIVNTDRQPPADFHMLKKYFACRKLILFGINPLELQLQNINNNDIAVISDTRILATFSFDEMRGDESKKRLFWNAMKRL